MKKYFCFLFFVIFVPCMGFCTSFYSEFLTINNALVDNKKAYFVKTRLNQLSKNGNVQNQSDAIGFFFGDNQILRIKQKNGYVYFLSTPNGYWVKNKNSAQPIKVSGDFKALNVQVQDILRIDYEKDYALDEQGDDYVFLRRVGKKSSFPYVKIKKTDSGFVKEILDRDKKPMRTVTDEIGTINKVKIFSKSMVQDNVFSDSSEYLFISLEQTEVSKTLFTPAFMEQLIELLDNKAKGI